MIYRIPKKNDLFKEQIERDKKKLESLPKESLSKQKDIVIQLETETLPKLEKDIEELIFKIKKDALSCNAKEILDYFGYIYGLTTSSKILEDTGSLKNSYLDYIFSLVMSLDYSVIDNNCSSKCLENLKKNIEKLHEQTLSYLMITSIDRSKVPDSLKFKQAISYLTTKGDSYTEHKIELCKELFTKYDELLIKNFGISSEKLINELIYISNVSLSNFDIQLQYMQEMKKSYQAFIDNANNVIADAQSEKECIALWQKSDYFKQTTDNLEKINKKTGVAINDSIFKIHQISLPEDILKQISMSIGENTIFKDGKIEYLPMNNSFIYEKPLVKIDDNYYCFNSPLIHYNLHIVMENIILNLISENKKSKQYYNKKGAYLEDKSLELFQQILPNCEVYKNLKYNKDDEVDGIVIYDNNIFIIEAKSNKFTLGARKGNTDKIKKNTKDIIEKAYQQAIRTKEYILSKDMVSFRDNKKRTVLNLHKEKIENIFLINTTLESLGHITTNLNSLDRFGFIKGKDWIWSVYLNDLRIIAEIIDSPSEFLLYLERRIKFNDYPQIQTMEEIDILGYFLHDGLYFDDIDFPKQNYMLMVTGYAEEIDAYYHWKEGNLDEVKEKPIFFKGCKKNVKPIVSKLENIKKINFSKISKFLLAYDCHTQTEIYEQFINILYKKRKNFSFFREEENLGFIFIDKEYSTTTNTKLHCRIIAYERKINHWFLIFVNGTSIQNFELDFQYFYFSNKYNKELEIEVKELRKNRVLQRKNVDKKIGRNETCPCGSGKKYKKCCLNYE